MFEQEKLVFIFNNQYRRVGMRVVYYNVYVNELGFCYFYNLVGVSGVVLISIVFNCSENSDNGVNY